MMTGTITDDQAKALAHLVASFSGDKRWDFAGVRAALSNARLKAPAHELAIAAIRCATEPGAKTPAVIGMDGPHWRDLEQAARTQRPSELPKCEDHGLFLPCRSCAAESKAHPDEEQKPATHHTDPEHLAIYERGARRARAAIKVPTNGEVR